MSSDESLDGDEQLRKKILPVAKFDDYDKNIPPRSGEEYLRRVQLEEKEYPEVLIKDISATLKPQTNKTINLELMNKDFIYLNDDRVPDQEWIDYIINEFSNLRLKINELRKKNEKHLENRYSNYNNLDLIWWQDVFENETKLPLLRLVLEYPQEHIKNGLKFITRYLKESRLITINQGKWIYTLLSCLELPLPSDYYYNLRNLSCVCSSIRNRYAIESKDQITSLNIIIYLIGKYFNQFDLIDGYVLK